MKNLLATLLTLAALTSAGQDWIDYKFDENLTVAVPNNLKVVDKNGQHLINGVIGNADAMVMVQTIPNIGQNAALITDRDDLIEQYKRYAEGVGKKVGSLMTREFLELDKLTAMRISLSETPSDRNYVRHYVVVLLKEKWYLIQFWELEGLGETLQNERDKFFTSVRFTPGLRLTHQLSFGTGKSLSYEAGQLIRELLFYLLVFGGIICSVVVIVVRRNRRNKNVTLL